MIKIDSRLTIEEQLIELQTSAWKEGIMIKELFLASPLWDKLKKDLGSFAHLVRQHNTDDIGISLRGPYGYLFVWRKGIE